MIPCCSSTSACQPHPLIAGTHDRRLVKDASSLRHQESDTSPSRRYGPRMMVAL
ncbi:hypothetical protein B0O80DRAFT_463291 [Mortierella sp. GBAus27b]|nr:hypothetical protein B0O80DRAFT_463291 [Mortierella sp. GBAus27b]